MLWSHGVTLLKGYNWASILQYSIAWCITWLVPLGHNQYHRCSLHLPPLSIHSTNEDPYHPVVLVDIVTQTHSLYLFNAHTHWTHPCIGHPEKYLNCLLFHFLQCNLLLSFLGVCNQDIYVVYGMADNKYKHMGWFYWLWYNTSFWASWTTTISLYCMSNGKCIITHAMYAISS